MKNVWVWLLAGGLSLSALAATAPAQENELLQDDIDFARELARFGYFDLSNEFLIKLEQVNTTKDARVSLSYAKASIYKLAAQFASTPDARTQFYDQAIEGYRSFLDSADPENQRYGAAQIEFGNVYVGYGQFLRERAAELPKEEATPLTEKADGHFKNAITLLNKVYENGLADAQAYLDVEEDDKAAIAYQEAFQALYQKAVCQFERALSYPPDDINRADYLQKSNETIEEFLFDNPDPASLTAYAYFYSGVANFELAKIEPDENSKASYLDYAVTSLRYVLEDGSWGVWIIFEENADIMNSSQKASYANLAERASYRLAMVYNEAGQKDQAIAVVDKLEQLREKFGFGKPGQYGSLAVLMKAEALRENGDYDSAIRLVQDIVENNKGSQVAAEAQGTLASWLGGDSDINVPPDVLWNVAEGTYGEKRYADAIPDYYRVLDAIVKSGDEEKRKEFAPKTWKRIGDCYNAMRRYLEAALAYETGLIDYPGADEGDRESNARGYYNSWVQRHRETKTDFDMEQKNRTRQKVATMGVGDLQFLIASDKFGVAEKADDANKKAAFQEALAAFDSVKESSLYYERAWIYRGRCHFEMGDPRKAVDIIDAYFAYTKDPANAPSAKEVRHRKIALADGTHNKAKFEKELGNFANVITILNGFEENHPEMETYFNSVLYLRLDSKTALGELDEAEKILAEMISTYPKRSATNFCRFRLANSGYFAAYEKLESEDKADTEEAKASLRRAAELLWDFSVASGHDSFSNLKLTGDWYSTLESFDLAKRSYQKTMEVFGDDAKHKVSIDNFVKRGLAEALTELGEFKEAKKWWDFYKPQTNPYKEIVYKAARCYGGWLKGEGGEYTEVPGSGDYKEAVALWSRYLREYFRADAEEDRFKKYSDHWWETKFMTIYARYRAGQSDASHLSAAKDLLKNTEALRPDLGGGEAKRQFRWLARRLR